MSASLALKEGVTSPHRQNRFDRGKEAANRRQVVGLTTNHDLVKHTSAIAGGEPLAKHDPRQVIQTVLDAGTERAVSSPFSNHRIFLYSSVVDSKNAPSAYGYGPDAWEFCIAPNTGREAFVVDIFYSERKRRVGRFIGYRESNQDFLVYSSSLKKINFDYILSYQKFVELCRAARDIGFAKIFQRLSAVLKYPTAFLPDDVIQELESAPDLVAAGADAMPGVQPPDAINNELETPDLSFGVGLDHEPELMDIEFGVGPVDQEPEEYKQESSDDEEQPIIAIHRNLGFPVEQPNDSCVSVIEAWFKDRFARLGRHVDARVRSTEVVFSGRIQGLELLFWWLVQVRRVFFRSLGVLLNGLEKASQCFIALLHILLKLANAVLSFGRWVAEVSFQCKLAVLSRVWPQAPPPSGFGDVSNIRVGDSWVIEIRDDAALPYQAAYATELDRNFLCCKCYQLWACLCCLPDRFLTITYTVTRSFPALVGDQRLLLSQSARSQADAEYVEVSRTLSREVAYLNSSSTALRSTGVRLSSVDMGPVTVPKKLLEQMYPALSSNRNDDALAGTLNRVLTHNTINLAPFRQSMTAVKEVALSMGFEKQRTDVKVYDVRRKFSSLISNEST